MISALQHLVFCERQWALIHLEQVWSENCFTVEGKNLHDKVHSNDTESRSSIKISRGLRVCSAELGLIGQTDVVEFHAIADNANLPPEIKGIGVNLPRKKGLWRPVPVEFKRGKPKDNRCDEIQLCAQALCLEEMLGVSIPGGALYYGQPKRKCDICFDDGLREMTRAFADKMHRLFARRTLPVGRFDEKCHSCSLKVECMPELLKKQRKAWDYLLEQCSPVREKNR
jgi:CRISPR-associated exonuclease Cas4